MKKCAYIRVSSREQNIGRQVEAMLSSGIEMKDMYIDKQSGKDFNRKAFKQLIKRLKAGDELYLKSIDRLGRDYEEVIEQWRYLTKIKNVDIVVLDFPLLDTRNNTNGLTGKFISDLVLQILSYVSQIERENIRQRQNEGIKLAKENGVKFGRPKAEIPEAFEEVYRLWKKEGLSKRQAAKLLKTNHNTFSRWTERHEESK